MSNGKTSSIYESERKGNAGSLTLQRSFPVQADGISHPGQFAAVVCGGMDVEPIKMGD